MKQKITRSKYSFWDKLYFTELNLNPIDLTWSCHTHRSGYKFDNSKFDMDLDWYNLILDNNPDEEEKYLKGFFNLLNGE